MVALQSVVSMIKDTTQAAMDDQVAMASLGKTLENVGQGFKQTGVAEPPPCAATSRMRASVSPS